MSQLGCMLRKMLMSSAPHTLIALQTRLTRGFRAYAVAAFQVSHAAEAEVASQQVCTAMTSSPCPCVRRAVHSLLQAVIVTHSLHCTCEALKTSLALDGVRIVYNNL
jgi:hypothetical protein